MFDGPWQTCMLVRGLNPSECASWVQAWGTIAAIFATVFAATWSYRKALSDRHIRELSERRERSRTIANLLAGALPIYKKVVEIECEMQVDPVTNWPDAKAMQRYMNYNAAAEGMDHDLFALDAYITALRRVDVTELADSDASQALIAGLFGVEKLAVHLRLMKSSTDVRDSLPHFIFGAVADGEQAVKRAEFEFRRRAR